MIRTERKKYYGALPARDARFARTPLSLRRSVPARKEGTAIISLSYRPPYNWSALMGYLMRHQTDQIEEVAPDAYIRYYPTRRGMGRVIVKNDEAKSRLVACFDRCDRKDLYSLIQKIRRLFDLDADPLLISTHFDRVTLLKELDRQSPGIRVPGAWNGFETAVGIILGQVVTMEQARRNMRQLLIGYGEKRRWRDKIAHVFPDPAKLAASDLSGVPVTARRKETIRTLARKIAVGEVSLNSHQDTGRLKAQLQAIAGIGNWTAEYIGMRCLCDPDSCPATDLILKRVADREPALDWEKASPWRAYAAFLVWNACSGKLRKNRK